MQERLESYACINSYMLTFLSLIIGRLDFHNNLNSSHVRMAFVAGNTK